MNERIKELAEQAGFECWKDEPYRPEGQTIDWASNYDEELERFAELVRADEREVCAKVCEQYCGAWDDEGYALTQAIRARGEAKYGRGNGLQTAIERGTKAWADVSNTTEWVEELRGSDTPEETSTLDRGCYERGCVAYDERDGDGVTIKQERVHKSDKSIHEPVAYLDEGLGAFYWPNEYKKDVGFTPLYAGFPHRWSNVTDDALMHEVRHRGFVIRDAQVGKKWVGLTDKELSLLWLEYHGDNFIADGRIINYEKALEAKLKEKNSP